MSSGAYRQEPWEEALERSERMPERRITRSQIAVYLAYGGDADLYQIRARPDPLMSNRDWATIGKLLQHMGALATGMASEAYRSYVEAELMRLTEDEPTRNLIWAIHLTETSNGHESTSKNAQKQALQIDDGGT